MQPATREHLSLFVEKAQILTSRRFLGHITDQGGLSISFKVAVDEPLTTASNMPDEEATHALGLTLRMFVQDNDRISLRNLDKVTDPGVSQDWKDYVAELRQALNNYLDEPDPTIKRPLLNGSLPTRRAILDTILYGDLAHNNPDKRKQVQAWRQDPLFALFIEYRFNSILIAVINAIAEIAWITELELKGEPIPARSESEEPEDESSQVPEP